MLSMSATESPRTIIVHATAPDTKTLPMVDAENLSTHTGLPFDALNRPLHDLRISVTDRCNFRCTYCMPRHVYGPTHRFLDQSALLTFEEIKRTSQLMVNLGVRKLRLTGGEPLMRKQLDRLVALLAALETQDGVPIEVAMTTNASLLAAHAPALKQAGLGRITVSLDALDNAIFQRMNDASTSVSQVLSGIEAAQHAGFDRIKVNMVVQRGVNDGQILPMVEHFRHTGIELRFIEYMDVGATNGWQTQDVMSAQEMRQLIETRHALRPMDAALPSDTAQRFAFADGGGSVGFIASVTQAFCRDCNRLRLSTDGKLFTCLFATQGTDIKTALRSGTSDAQLQAQLAALWRQRQDRYSELRGNTPAPSSRVEMSYIGG
jgi:GTP 3',8-cyclase